MRVKDYLWVGQTLKCKKCKHIEYGYRIDDADDENCGVSDAGFETAQKAFAAAFTVSTEGYDNDEDKNLDQWEEFIALHPKLKLHLPIGKKR